jgi:NADH-quinone oxidoreductase subunit J
MMTNITFGALAACLLATGIMVVRSRNLIRAALWLGATLVVTAGLYALLGASFLAAVQVLLYVGGIMTLLIFGVMITRRHDGLDVPAESRNQVPAAAAAVTVFVAVASAIHMTPELEGRAAGPAPSAAVLGKSILVEHVFAFEVLSILLLGAIVGAIVLARKRDPGAEARVIGRTPMPARGAAQKSADDASDKVAA